MKGAGHAQDVNMTAQGGGPLQCLALLRDMNAQVSVAALAVVTPISLACLQLRAPTSGLQPRDVRSKAECGQAGSVADVGSGLAGTGYRLQSFAGCRGGGGGGDC